MSIQESPMIFDQMKVCEGEITLDTVIACARLTCTVAECKVAALTEGEIIGKLATVSGDNRDAIRYFSRLELPEVCTRLQDCSGVPPTHRLPNALK